MYREKSEFLLIMASHADYKIVPIITITYDCDIHNYEYGIIVLFCFSIFFISLVKRQINIVGKTYSICEELKSLN